LVIVNGYPGPVRCDSLRLPEQTFAKSRALVNRSQDGQTAEPEILLCIGVIAKILH
jgi:hypothetical protein